MYVYKYNLRYEISVIIIWFKLKGILNVKIMFKKKKIIQKFVVMFSNASNISFTDFESEGVNGVLIYDIIRVVVVMIIVVSLVVVIVDIIVISTIIVVSVSFNE